MTRKISTIGKMIPKLSFTRLAGVLSAAIIALTLVTTPVSAQSREATVLLKADTVIEVSYGSIEGGKEMQLMGDYLPKIMPIVESYGGKMLGNFQVTAVTGGEITPQMVAIFEWPSLEARNEMHADEAAKELFPLREDAMTFFKQAFYTVDEDTPLTFHEDKTYEFFTAWLTFAAKASLPAYFVMSDAPKQNYGPPRFIATLKPLEDGPNGSYVLNPDMAGIVEWNNTATYYGLVNNPGFKLAAPLLSASVSRLDMVHTRFAFPQ
ncbi:DUF1330 domain-containing protein [Pseudohalocynthiibacter aestuariivivens]|uniref:DUF1330 domain-containing protein n=1 Tax=Pseudohalocynthiibacter aestuariivivens TaxID=1591409 RepID=A0ABV5JJC6_9RHOB|nr:DUF1330 domain-containing protein [Pseudohalocynthiibacter aestuariivivens]MBS9716470.1 DUF1330 domain-containing protein [Pseudohalocynthiibacter aestuariivivens]